MNLLALADFNLVARHGGFGRAARAAGRPKATLSRRVSELEGALALRLFERGARTLTLTEDVALQELLEWAQDAFAAAFAWDRHTDVVVVPDDAELADIGIGGYVARAAQDLTDTAGAGGRDAVAASDALRLLYRYARGGARA
mgnify:CR=1 FL=1